MTIYDNADEKILDVEVDDNSYRYRAIMGDDNLTLYFSLAEHVEIPLGAYVVFQSERYTLERPENLKMHHSRYFEYTVTFDAPQAKAGIWKFRNIPDGRLKFPLTAKPHEHLKMFVDNMNARGEGSWTVGECVEGVETLIAYDHDYCIDALKRMAETFNTEYEIDGRRVSLRKVEYNKGNPLPLSYGRGNGFKSGVSRQNGGDTPPVEILYVQGGDRNIDPSKYGNSELLLPKSQTIAYDGEHFEDEGGFNSATARRYVTDGYGYSIRRADKPLASQAEDSLDCSEIYPKRVGTVTDVKTEELKTEDGDTQTVYDIIDTTIPASLNYRDCRIAGETATVIFQSGMLAGREFDIVSTKDDLTGYDHAARRFQLVSSEQDGQMMPGGVFVPKVGDTYAVFGINLPDAYVCDNGTKSGASWDMFREAVKYLYEHEEEQFTFNGELDGIWAKKDWLNIGGRLIPGGYVLFSDERFQKEGIPVRITGIKQYVNKPHSPEIELSNQPITTGVSSALKKLEAEEVVNEQRHKDALNFTRRRFRDAQETIGMLDAAWQENFSHFSGSISPLTVQTMMMLVGDESLQFRFVDSKTNPKAVNHDFVYDKAKRQLTTEAGIIQHLTLGINTLCPEHDVSEYKFWDMERFTSSVLDDPSKKYYLYAKCPKTSQKGNFMLSETAIAMDGDTDYHLLVGILNSEYEGERSFVTLYGFTEILPGRITTDKIVSTDGNTYFDLLKGIISGRITFTSGSSGLKNLEEWPELDERVENAQKSADEAADAAAQAGKDAKKAVSDLKENVEGAFRDGIIDETERKRLENDINVINTTLERVRATYAELYGNAFLTGAAKTGLESKYDAFITAANALTKSITDAIEDDKATGDEADTVNKNYSAFNSAYADFEAAVEAANKAIQNVLKNYSDKAVDNAWEAAKEDWAKNLGYESYDDLVKYAEAGETIIAGGKINTTLIDAELIVTAALLAKLVKVTELIAENLTVTGNSKIAGFSVSGNGLTNTPFDNDAYVIFRNDEHGCFAGIGGNVLPITSGLRAVARFENEDASDWWGLGRNVAMLLSAKNGTYNHAFLGEGNGNLNGWIGGYRYSKYDLTSANTIYSGYSNLKDNNRWVIYSSADNSGITLPKLSEVRDALGIGTSTKFCVEFTIISDIDSRSFDIYGRNNKKSSDDSYPWNTSDYPNLMNWDNDHWDSVTMGPGDSLTVLLIYDSSKSGSKGNYPLTYTARIINRQN